MIVQSLSTVTCSFIFKIFIFIFIVLENILSTVSTVFISRCSM